MPVCISTAILLNLQGCDTGQAVMGSVSPASSTAQLWAHWVISGVGRPNNPTLALE